MMIHITAYNLAVRIARAQAAVSLIYSQNKKVAARAMAERATVGDLSFRVATRRQSFGRPNMISILLRLL